MKIAIIGLGYVGLPLSLQFASSGVNVLGIDVDEGKIENLLAGKSYIKHIESDLIAQFVQEGKLSASNDFSRIREVDAVVICVPTPLNKYREPDLSYVLDTGKAITPYLGQHEGEERDPPSEDYGVTGDTQRSACNGRVGSGNNPKSKTLPLVRGHHP